MQRETKQIYEFGPFRVDAGERLLLRNSETVSLTPKTFDLLLALVENRGRALDKEVLMKMVWPDTFVEEVNLAKGVFLLRKTLGEGYIETLPKRGYRFIGDVRAVEDEETVIEEHSVSRVTIEQIETTAGRRRSVVLTVGAAILLMSAAGIAYLTRPMSHAPAFKSLAILPLKSLTHDGPGQHLELGIADGIINKVSQIPGLTVRPTRAIRKYVNADTDPLKAAQDLKVDAVLDGTLQYEGDRVRVGVNLLETHNGASLWAHTFDIPSGSIFDNRRRSCPPSGCATPFST